MSIARRIDGSHKTKALYLAVSCHCQSCLSSESSCSILNTCCCTFHCHKSRNLQCREETALSYRYPWGKREEKKKRERNSKAGERQSESNLTISSFHLTLHLVTHPITYRIVYYKSSLSNGFIGWIEKRDWMVECLHCLQRIVAQLISL